MTTKESNRNSITETNGEVLDVTKYDGNQISLRIHCPWIAENALPGQFVHIRCSKNLEMRRPMSIMRASKKTGWIQILFKTTGSGTIALAESKKGDTLNLLGPVGNPFRLKNFLRHLVLIGGGVGIPPLLFLAEHLKQCSEDITVIVLMGSETPFPFKLSPSQIYVDCLPGSAIAGIPLLETMGIASRLATNQNFSGCYDGHVTDLAKQYLENMRLAKDEVEIFACGPAPMLVEVQKIASDYCRRSQISVEEYMACAVGGCAGCTIPIHTEKGLQMKRVCVDGPVFDGSEVVLS